MQSFQNASFGLGQVSFPSHMVSRDDIYVDLTKIEVVTSWPQLFIVSEVRSFLSLIGYYRRFV